MKTISATKALNLCIEAGIKKGLEDVTQGRLSPFTIERAERLKRKFKSQSK